MQASLKSAYADFNKRFSILKHGNKYGDRTGIHRFQFRTSCFIITWYHYNRRLLVLIAIHRNPSLNPSNLYKYELDLVYFLLSLATRHYYHKLTTFRLLLTSAPDSEWAIVNHRFNLLKDFCSGIATIFPNTATAGMGEGWLQDELDRYIA